MAMDGGRKGMNYFDILFTIFMKAIWKRKVCSLNDEYLTHN